MDRVLDFARIATEATHEESSGEESGVAVRPVKSRAVAASKETTPKKSKRKSKTPTKSSKGAVMTQGTDEW